MFVEKIPSYFFWTVPEIVLACDIYLEKTKISSNVKMVFRPKPRVVEFS